MKQKFLKYKYIIIPLLIASLFAVFSYFYIPSSGYDLYEYYGWMDKMLTFSRNDLINYIFYRLEFIIMIYFYLMANIGKYQLVQVLPTFLFYFIILYISFDFFKEKKGLVLKKIFAIVTFLSLFKYISIVSNLRYSLAYSIFSLAIYFDLYKRKKTFAYKILYIIPLFIHTSSIILILFRLIFSIKPYRLKYLFVFIICFFLFFPHLLINILSVFDFLPLASFFVERLYMYLVVEAPSFSLQYYFRICQVFLFFACVLILIKKDRRKTNIYLYFFMMTLFTISLIPYYTLFLRILDFLTLLFPIILFALLEMLDDKNLNYIICLIIFMFVIAGIKIQIPIFINMYL